MYPVNWTQYRNFLGFPELNFPHDFVHLPTLDPYN